jgi:hypothetical protein
MTAIVQIGWHALDTWSNPDWDYPYYVRCDICHEDACEDIWAAKSEPDFRQFHKVVGGADNGLVVCEHCVGAYLTEKP